MAMSMLLSSAPLAAAAAPVSSSSSSYLAPLDLKVMSSLPRRRSVTATSIRSSSEKAGESGSGGHGVDRRNILIGLGGLYGATTLSGSPSATAAPIMPPDLRSCHSSNYPDGYGDSVPVQCCPPYTPQQLLDIKPYVFPTNAPLRRRKPAHLLSQFEKDRFKSAVAQMKALPRSDPWSFQQQAQIHCAYCNEGYNQKNTSTPLQVHFSWLFLPWHRYYLYFFERILGKIVGDETFALPYWGYADVDGMDIPPIYLDASSSLYNSNRNGSHLDQVVNFNYSYDIEDQPPPPDVVTKNLEAVQAMYTDTLGAPELFMGSPVKAGEATTAATANQTSGTCENLHNVVHMWVGNVEAPNTDMGNFFSAARDAVFYCHHGGVDRFWDIYRKQRATYTTLPEFTDPDWLNATFIFYDENKQIVTVKVSDCLFTENLSYIYESKPSPTPTPRPSVPTGKKTLVPIGEFGPTPRPLTETIRAVVKRPKASRTPAEKRREVEVLNILNIDLLDPEPIRFDVYVNQVIQGSFTTGLGNLSGSFLRVRHSNIIPGGGNVKAGLKLPITTLVENLGADADETVAVSIVPRNGQVQIGGVSIELLPTFF